MVPLNATRHRCCRWTRRHHRRCHRRRERRVEGLRPVRGRARGQAEVEQLDVRTRRAGATHQHHVAGLQVAMRDAGAVRADRGHRQSESRSSASRRPVAHQIAGCGRPASRPRETRGRGSRDHRADRRRGWCRCADRSARQSLALLLRSDARDSESAASAPVRTLTATMRSSRVSRAR